MVTPAYQSLHEVARAAGAQVSALELEHDSGWALDLDDVRRELRPDTRAIVVNFPHNPTGAHIDRATLDGLVEIAEDAGAHLFSDEVYRWLEHAPRSAAAGRRRALGPRAEPRRDVEDLRAARAAHRLAGLPRPRAAGAHRGDQGLHDDLQQRPERDPGARSRCGAATTSWPAAAPSSTPTSPLLDDFFARWDGVFEWVRPRGAAIGFPRLLAATPIDDFARELVAEEGVLLLPGSIYEHPGNHFRIGFGRRNMPEALARLERFASARL